ncbi:MAG TPA: ShlB/FhaC/HecB family hemolysin secretion/activation protein [Dongiaceae bacterium]|nr:ShlB/FhaC/HecB family hemolysin secretion/activation protein [Dongiaceae bacterium]
MPRLLLQSLTLLIALFVATGLLAETEKAETELFGSGAQFEMAPQQPGKSATAIPSLPQSAGKKDLIVNGKIEVRRVELRGDALYPRYGITQQFLNERLNRSFRSGSAWMAIPDMHRMADELTLAYHEKGLTFNQVFVIPQEIKNNTLVLNVLAGRLSEINVARNQLYSAERIRQPFRHLLGQVVYEPDIQAAMLEANQMPGLRVFGFFSVGQFQGQTRLNLSVLEETANVHSLRLDNWGVQDTGVARIIYQYQRNNLSDHADILQATLLATNETGNVYGSLGYRIPLNNKMQTGVSLLSNQFEIAGPLAQFGLDGHLEAVSGLLNWNLLYARNARADLNSNLALKKSTVSSDLFEEILGETVDYAVLQSGFQAAVLAADNRIRQAFALTPALGVIEDTSNPLLDSEFFLLKAEYELQYRWQPASPRQYASTISLDLLYTPQVIPSAERAIVTGANGVRGYDPALFSADTAWQLTLEQSLMSFVPFTSSALVPFLFADYAQGEQNTAFGATARFTAAGVGLDFLYGSHITARVTAGFPLQEELESASEDFEPVAFGYISLSF